MLFLGAYLLRAALLGAYLLRAALLGSVLGSALGLQVGGMEDAITPEVSFGERLRIIFKSIGRGFAAGVDHRDQVAVLAEHKFHPRSGALDGAGCDVAGHAQPPGVNGATLRGLLLELGDGHVIAL